QRLFMTPGGWLIDWRGRGWGAGLGRGRRHGRQRRVALGRRAGDGSEIDRRLVLACTGSQSPDTAT
ncbi:MAG: hypothetical protein ACXU95_10570, partial [Isosphaeraceae bacterium]